MPGQRSQLHLINPRGYATPLTNNFHHRGLDRAVYSHPVPRSQMSSAKILKHLCGSGQLIEQDLTFVLAPRDASFPRSRTCYS